MSNFGLIASKKAVQSGEYHLVTRRPATEKRLSRSFRFSVIVDDEGASMKEIIETLRSCLINYSRGAIANVWNVIETENEIYLDFDLEEGWELYIGVGMYIDPKSPNIVRIE